MSEASLQIVRRFRSDPQRVYEACTDPALLKRWYGPSEWTVTELEADVRVGGTFHFSMIGPDATASAEGIYQILEPPHRIVHSWRWSDDERVSRVTYLIEADGDGTRLTFTHERLQDQDSADSHQQGWSQALDKLEHLLGA